MEAEGNNPAIPAVVAAERSAKLELMLGFIANYAQIFNRNTIIRDSTSLKSVFQMLRKHFGFQSSGAQFLNIVDVRLRAEERPETLYQRLLSFVEDNLQKVGNDLSHRGELPAEDEEMSPMIENLLTYMWLERVHPGLPKLVQLRFSTELRSRTLASLKDEISQSLSSMLEELRSTHTQQLVVNAIRPPPSRGSTSAPSSRARQTRRAHCELCSALKQQSDHFLSRCPRVSEDNKKLLKAGLRVKLADVDQFEGESEEDEDSSGEVSCSSVQPKAQPSCHPVIVGRVATAESSPYIDVFCGTRAARITLDTGCVGGNCIKAEVAQRLNLPISKTKRKAFQADGTTPLAVVGEVKTVFTRDAHRLPFRGLVVKDLEVDILGGTPFLRENDMYDVLPCCPEYSICGQFTVPIQTRWEYLPRCNRQKDLDHPAACHIAIKACKISVTWRGSRV